MAETETPKTGKLSKKQWYAIAGVGGAYVAYRWWKSRQSSATGATTGAAAAGTPIGTDANGNPVYMNSSGQEVDASGNPDSVVAASGTTGTSGTGYTNPAPIASDGLPAAGSAPQTDEQWTQAVSQALQQIGYDPQTVATAIAQYLASQPLTPAQVTIIRTAWSYEGRPPGEPNLPIIQQSTGGGTGTGGGGGGTVAPTVTALKPGQILYVQVLMQKGMTWQTVADHAGISVTHLQMENPGHSGAPGDTIRVPVEVKASGWSATWQSIADYWGISPLHLQQENPSIDQTPGAVTTPTTVTSTV